MDANSNQDELEKEAQEIGNFIKLTLRVILGVSFILILLTLIYNIMRILSW